MPIQRGLNTRKQSGTVKKSTATATDNILRHLAFDNSIQPNIITTASTGKIIIANSAARKLLGYSKKELLTKSRSDIFDVKEDSFKKMLKQRRAQGQSKALLSVITKGGKALPCEITSAIFMDNDGHERAIYTITDMRQSIVKQKNIDVGKERRVANNIILAQAKSNARLAQNNEWIKYIAKASYDVMWDWDIVTGEIYVGDSIEEVFGYRVPNNIVTFKDFRSCLVPEQKNTVKKKLMAALASGNKSWEDSFMFKRQGGSVASTMSRASIVRNEEGKAIRMIGATQDVSVLLELENKLQEQVTRQKTLTQKNEKTRALNTVVTKSRQKEIDSQKEKMVADNIILAQLKSDARLAKNNQEQDEKFLIATKLSFDGIWDWNLLTNEFFLGEGFEKLFGHAIKNSKGGTVTDWTRYLHPDDRESVEKALENAIASSATHWEHAYRFIKANGSIAKVFGRASIIRDANGKATRMIGVIHDLSRQKELEDRLDQEIKLKEKQIAEATEEARESERSGIGKELHDNVNQLLGASRLYLNMAKRGGKDSDMLLSRSSQYTLSAIEEIRKLTKVLTTDTIKTLGLSEAINNIRRDTMEVNPIKISCSLESFIEHSISEKFKLNIFRIVQEQLNNILKHAHATEVTIGLSQNKNSIILLISDNGVGFNTHKKSKGIGISNIISRAKLFNGKANFISEPGAGCSLIVNFTVDTLRETS